MANFLIIGGTSGIGLSVTKKLLLLGHKVIITGRDSTKTDKIGQALNIDTAILEANNFTAVDAIFESVKNKFTVIDGVVNCAGSLLLKSAHMTQQEEYEKILSANLTTAFAVVRSAGKYMIQDGGSVVLLSSAAALIGIPNHEAIAAAKAAIVGLTLSAAASYASNHLRFNAVAPGLIDTPLSAKLISNESSRNASIAMHALGRLGQPEDVASAIVFLLLPENNWITGQIIAIDGGLSTLRPKLKM